MFEALSDDFETFPDMFAMFSGVSKTLCDVFDTLPDWLLSAESVPGAVLRGSKKTISLKLARTFLQASSQEMSETIYQEKSINAFSNPQMEGGDLLAIFSVF